MASLCVHISHEPITVARRRSAKSDRTMGNWDGGAKITENISGDVIGEATLDGAGPGREKPGADSERGSDREENRDTHHVGYMKDSEEISAREEGNK